ncbi:flagellar export protein FliJ [Roseateles koreensis]|uniref:Flagellar FliJ protein n=1 Tax=Roseateles koreensis TaxID=2987526 RepID=A0ABT5KTU1_9BURK|nr:flagellar export protein FliJ [Roseateles koreensis]MDC8786363.1 flagellar export protein FliJ [Roseateles koreensis]
MSSSNLQVLNILLERAESERDEALRLFQEADKRAAHARNQHGELNQYRSDYQQRWSQQFATRGTMDIVTCYQTFGGKLDEAITSQGHVAQHADQRMNVARDKLREAEMRVASIAKLIERRRLESSRAAQRQEQKACDEQAARSAASAYNPFVRLSA